MDYIIVECPHCNGQIQIFKNEINCTIFRHAVFKNTFQQVNPHASQQECEQLLQSGRVVGCCKPFKINRKNGGEYEAVICDYI
jgi:hypothetical protein